VLRPSPIVMTPSTADAATLRLLGEWQQWIGRAILSRVPATCRAASVPEGAAPAGYALFRTFLKYTDQCRLSK
jgi:hypothetical protein